MTPRFRSRYEQLLESKRHLELALSRQNPPGGTKELLFAALDAINTSLELVVKADVRLRKSWENPKRKPKARESRIWRWIGNLSLLYLGTLWVNSLRRTGPQIPRGITSDSPD